MTLLLTGGASPARELADRKKPGRPGSDAGAGELQPGGLARLVQPDQQLAQRLQLGRGHPGHLFGRAPRGGDGGEDLLALRRRDGDADAAVLRIEPAFDEALALHAVEHRHQRRLVDAGAMAELVLRLRLLALEQHQDHVVAQPAREPVGERRAIRRGLEPLAVALEQPRQVLGAIESGHRLTRLAPDHPAYNGPAAYNPVPDRLVSDYTGSYTPKGESWFLSRFSSLAGSGKDPTGARRSTKRATSAATPRPWATGASGSPSTTTCRASPRRPRRSSSPTSRRARRPSASAPAASCCRTTRRT